MTQGQFLQEFQELVAFLGGIDVAGKKLKSTTDWEKEGNGTDDFGFAAKPFGQVAFMGNQIQTGSYGYWWTKSEVSMKEAKYVSLFWNFDGIQIGNYNKQVGLSIRCIKD